MGFVLRYPFLVPVFLAAFPTSNSKDAERMTGNKIDKILQLNNGDCEGIPSIRCETSDMRASKNSSREQVFSRRDREGWVQSLYCGLRRIRCQASFGTAFRQASRRDRLISSKHAQGFPCLSSQISCWLSS
jgi:hypothetical protein